MLLRPSGPQEGKIGKAYFALLPCHTCMPSACQVGQSPAYKRANALTSRGAPAPFSAFCPLGSMHLQALLVSVAWHTSVCSQEASCLSLGLWPKERPLASWEHTLGPSYLLQSKRPFFRPLTLQLCKWGPAPLAKLQM